MCAGECVEGALANDATVPLQPARTLLTMLLVGNQLALLDQVLYGRGIGQAGLWREGDVGSARTVCC